MATLKLITFDLDNTLWDATQVIARAEQAFQNWLTQQHPTVIQQLGQENISAIRLQVIRDNPDLLHNLSLLRQKSIGQIFLTAGYTHEQSQTLAQEGFEVFFEARNQVIYYRGALDCIQQLAQKYTLGALSNGNACIKKVGLNQWMNFHFNSENTGYAKPHPTMFEKALATTNCTAEQCLHIGDHPEQDIEAAANLGLKTLWINFNQQTWDKEILPDAELNHWHDAEQIIQSIENK